MHQTAQAWCLAWGLDMAKHWERCAVHFCASLENEVVTCVLQHSCIVQCQISIVTAVLVVGRRKREMHVTMKPLISLLKPASSETLLDYVKLSLFCFLMFLAQLMLYPKLSVSHIYYLFSVILSHTMGQGFTVPELPWNWICYDVKSLWC